MWCNGCRPFHVFFVTLITNRPIWAKSRVSRGPVFTEKGQNFENLFDILSKINSIFASKWH